jgi:hypothetical protein
VAEWDIEVIWRPFLTPRWDVSASKPDEVSAKWEGFFRPAVNLTMSLVKLKVDDLLEQDSLPTAVEDEASVIGMSRTRGA